MVAFFGLMLFPFQSGSINFVVLPLVSTLPHGTSFIPSLLSETIQSLSLCCEIGSGKLGCCVHLLQLWFCSHLSVISKAQPVGFLRKNRVKIIVTLGLHFIGDIAVWLRYLFGLGPTGWLWRVKWEVTRWQGQIHYVGLLDVLLVGIQGYPGYDLGMAMRQFGDTQHVPRLSDLFVITCEYGLQDIDIVIIDRIFDVQKERKSTIDYPIYLGDYYEWSSVKFREWRATQDSCFIIDLSVLDLFDLHLPTSIWRDFTQEFEVRVQSTLRDLKECLTEATRDRDCCKEILDATMEDFDDIGRTNEAELVTLRAQLTQRDQVPSAMRLNHSIEIPGHQLGV